MMPRQRTKQVDGVQVAPVQVLEDHEDERVAGQFLEHDLQLPRHVIRIVVRERREDPRIAEGA